MSGDLLASLSYGVFASASTVLLLRGIIKGSTLSALREILSGKAYAEGLPGRFIRAFPMCRSRRPRIYIGRVTTD